MINVLTHLLKRTLRYILYTFVKKNQNKVGEKGKERNRTTLENYLAVSTKAEHTYTSYDPKIPPLEICPKRHTGIAYFIAL